jgi:hypothetical protein
MKRLWLLLIASIFVSDVLSTLVVDFGTFQETYRAPYVYFGSPSFNITAELIILTNYDSCDNITQDLTGKIVISPAYADCPTSENELGIGIRANNIMLAGGQVFI